MIHKCRTDEIELVRIIKKWGQWIMFVSEAMISIEYCPFCGVKLD